MSHWRYVLRITYPHYASLSGACTWEGYGLRITYPYCIKRRKPAGEGYGLRITYPYYVSSAESPPERAMYYALCIRSIKRRKPAGEGYVLRITYPYYVSSAESPPVRAMYYALRIRIMYQATNSSKASAGLYVRWQQRSSLGARKRS